MNLDILRDAQLTGAWWKSSMMAGQTVACFGYEATPPDVRRLMYRIGKAIVTLGGRVRSGHSQGADQAFQRGAAVLPSALTVCLPYAKYNEDVLPPKDSNIIVFNTLHLDAQAELFIQAELHHPTWDLCTRMEKATHARNMLVVKHATWGFCFLNRRVPESGDSHQCHRYLAAKSLPIIDFADPSVVETWEYILTRHKA